jgi:hypothetical protein
MDPIEEDSNFKKIVYDNGFLSSDPAFIGEILDGMYKYIHEKTEIPHKELSFYLHKLEELLGSEDMQSFGLDDICNWLITLSQHPNNLS